MSDTQKYIQSIVKQYGTSPTGNAPTEYADRQKQYLGDRTKNFTADRAYLSSDYVACEAQGILSDFYEYVSTYVRFSDVTDSAEKRKDDSKEVLFSDSKIDYFPIGAKLKTMGSTWLCTNPSNISSVNATAIVSRCNTSYNSYDYYGNVVTEPIVLEKYNIMSNNDAKSQNLVLLDGYYNVTAQNNATTQKLGDNKRIILGTKAYHITGFSDFVQEFSGDRDSNHLLTFTVRADEIVKDDDMTHFVANGKSHTFAATASVSESQVTEGLTTQIEATFLIDGEAVESSEEYPVTWEYETDDESIATVSSDGTITAVKAGNCLVKAVLSQNKEVYATAEITVIELLAVPYVKFTSVVPSSISQYDKITIKARYYEVGLATQEPLTWELSGAGTHDYNATIAKNGKSVTIQCNSASDIPLTVTAKYGEYSATAQIELVGY